MIRALNRWGDRMVSRLVPHTKADADFCYTESCCTAKYCRECCNDPVLGKSCRPWYYC